MFSCYVHNWTHPNQMCPMCHPVHTWTSSGTVPDDGPSFMMAAPELTPHQIRLARIKALAEKHCGCDYCPIGRCDLVFEKGHAYAGDVLFMMSLIEGKK